ncbi:MAG: U32 family peptidase C-terminal domain-containing protein [Candidatus Stygibacter frigidus]|nr:U32 family peptidase C-terminal domain-containing protein [Candidatus Stygibacter frigidus]
MELLSPAGDIHKLQYALAYGADAVYASGTSFGLRSHSRNFDSSELSQAVQSVHAAGKKIYITVNIYAHNKEIAHLKEYLQFLAELHVDALIISDPGVLMQAQQYAPHISVHISTQANVTSWSSVKFWQQAGAKRIILARELGINEISEIKQRVPEMELEMFVHGAMCMSYSGRCLLSAYLNGRHANLGDCSQPCRWEYYLKEKSRPDEEFTIEEDEYGSYILNSRDLCLIDRMTEIAQAGVDSIKIEGRMKSLYYVANVTRIYREAISAVQQNIAIDPELRHELEKVSHRVYSEGFFEGLNSMEKQYYDSSAYIRNYQFLGEIIEHENNWITVNVKSKFSVDEEIELVFPNRSGDIRMKAGNMINEESEQIFFTKPNTVVKIEIEGKCPSQGILRKRIEDK